MSGKRLIVGAIVMGVLVPFTLFYLLRLRTLAELFAVAATCFLSWGVADLIAAILEKPRLEDRSPSGALRHWEQSTLGTEDEADRES